MIPFLQFIWSWRKSDFGPGWFGVVFGVFLLFSDCICRNAFITWRQIVGARRLLDVGPFFAFLFPATDKDLAFFSKPKLSKKHDQRSSHAP